MKIPKSLFMYTCQIHIKHSKATRFFRTELEYIWGQNAKLLHTVHHMSNHFHLLHLLTFAATHI